MDFILIGTDLYITTPHYLTEKYSLISKQPLLLFQIFQPPLGRSSSPVTIIPGLIWTFGKRWLLFWRKLQPWFCPCNHGFFSGFRPANFQRCPFFALEQHCQSEACWVFESSWVSTSLPRLCLLSLYTWSISVWICKSWYIFSVAVVCVWTLLFNGICLHSNKGQLMRWHELVSSALRTRSIWGGLCRA